MRLRSAWRGVALLGILSMGSSCGLLFSDIASGGGGGGGGGSGDGGRPEGGGGGTGQGTAVNAGGAGGGVDCSESESVVSLGIDRWLTTFASARILDVSEVGPTIVAVGTAMANTPCGVPFEDPMLQGERLFILAVDAQTGNVVRVVDLGGAQGAKIRLSHGDAPLAGSRVVWTRDELLCSMTVTEAESACPPGPSTLRCELEPGGQFRDVGVAMTDPPVVLVQPDSLPMSCAPGGAVDITAGQYHLLPIDSNLATSIGDDGATSVTLTRLTDKTVRVAGLCAEGELIAGATCEGPSFSPGRMFAFDWDVSGGVLGDLLVFITPLGSTVEESVASAVPSTHGLGFSATSSQDHLMGWAAAAVLDAEPEPILRAQGLGDAEFPTGIRSAERFPGGAGQALTAVFHNDPSYLKGGEPFACPGPPCLPYAAWFQANGNGIPLYALVGSDGAAELCENGGVEPARGLSLQGSAIIGGRYRCGRLLIGGQSTGLAARDEDSAFLLRVTPVSE